VDLSIHVTPLADPLQWNRFSGASAPDLREDRSAVDARELLVSNLPLIERVVSFTCRRQRLDPDDAEDFGGVVRLKLIENDYAVLRKFEGRSSFATFITVVIQRLLLDYRIHAWGKWHASAEAKRLGETAVELEKLLNRDGRSVEEATTLMSTRDPALSRETVQSIAARLPQRAPKRRMVPLDEAGAVSVTSEPVVDSDRRRTSEQVSTVVRGFIDALAPEDRLILQLRFDGGMTVAEIARSLHLDQKQLYRRIEKQLRELRTLLENSGIDADTASDVIGDRGVLLDFRLGSHAARPSINKEPMETKGQEEISR
jgi:RNA polymerase sigma factor (sigma-70 family)